MARERIQIPKTFITDSWALLKNNRSLYLLPLINLVTTAILFFAFVSMVVAPVFMQEMSHAGQATFALISKVILMILSLVLIPLISNVINAAIILYCDALIRDEKITIGMALSKALKRTPDLALWSFIQGTVGFLLSLIDNTHQVASELVIDMFFGAAWGLISFFVLPIILLDDQNAFSAIKSSAQMVKHLWSKRAVLRLGIFGLTMFLLFGIGAAIIALGFYAGGQLSFYIVGLGVVFLLALAYTNKLLMLIIRMKLYLAIKEGSYQVQATNS